MTTPTKSKPITMDFPTALKEIAAGKKVACLSWHNGDYCWLNGEWLSIYRDENAERPGVHRWAVSSHDIFAKDWVVIG